ncbi:MAG TPA: pyrroloquinoline quinone-dependent dehydrogenase [Terriglobales bacterium]|nr:pyrroloquinoline quinone-dependent dehydrogenase [Terriglobales bacterium]
MEWPNYGNDAGGMRYSSLTQINRENVAKLRVAWTFHTGDISQGDSARRPSGFETTPIMVDGTLFLTTAFNRVIALDPETGKQRWAYDPHIDQSWQSGDGLTNRGVASWLDRKLPPGKPCRRRIFEATIDARLVAVDATDGKPCADFGHSGEVSLRDIPRFRPGWYHMTSPPTIVGEVVIVGSAIDDNGRADMPSGVVRGYDVRTGALRWTWDPIAHREAPANSTSSEWPTGAANAWSIMSSDPDAGLVFVPTGSASPDYYGGLRPGDDKWANSVVALRASDGEFIWGFQLVHHDLWDYDTASPPLLVDLDRGGKKLPAVIQGNKTGLLYVLDRRTGAPIFPVMERAVPQSDVPGEIASPTQPFPATLPSLSPQHVSADDAWGLTPEDREACRAELAGLRNEGIFTPPAVRGSLAIPGNIGGMTWSGAAFDPQRGLLVTNTNNFPTKVRLIPRADFDSARSSGERGEYATQTGTPYGMFRRPLLSPKYRLPCVPPPWGMLAAVDIAAGKIRWQVPLGSFDLGGPHKGVPPGSISLGGSIVTAAGLVFVAGTLDPFIRAFDIETGKELWKAQLPASAHAMPMTYQSAGGRQFIVIAAGGHAHIDEEPKSDAVVAFTLP